MAWEPKVNRHVQLLKLIDVDTIKPVPGVITAFATNGDPIIRVGRHDTDDVEPGVQLELFGNATTGVPRRVDPAVAIAVTSYISY